MLYPMAFMVLLTVIVGLITVSVRISSVEKGAVRAKFYKLMQGQDVPELVTKTTRNFNNMFEIPVLFYVVAKLYIVLGVNDGLSIALAWSFVLFRYIHAFIHISYNHVLHRLFAYGLAFLCVIGLWVNLLVSVS